MKRDEALAILRAEKERLHKDFGVKSLALFGSVVRDEATDKSDVDLLVEFDRPISLFDLVETAQYLENLLKVAKVDLIIRDNVIEDLKEIIYAEAINVFDTAEMEVSSPTHA